MAALAESPQAFGERTEEAAQRSDVEWGALAEKLAARSRWPRPLWRARLSRSG